MYRLDKNGIIQSRIPFKENKVGDDYSHKVGVQYVMKTHKPYISNALVSSSGIKTVSILIDISEDTVIGNIEQLRDAGIIHWPNTRANPQYS